MRGTNSTTSGPARTTRLPRPVKLRVAGAAFLILLLVALIAWMKGSTWQRVRQVQQEFAAIRTESFYLGVYLRGGIWKLNSMLLRFQLSREEAEREGFHREARELSEWLGKTKASLTTPEQQELARQVESAFEQYLAATAPFLEKRLATVRKDTSALIHQELVAKSEPVLRLCEELVRTQRAALAQCFTSSHAALGSLRQLLQLSSLYLLALVAALAGLIYRLLVVPMQFKLDQSQAAIERQEKLASLGVLAAGVAHEIRNPLTAMKFRLFSFKKELPEPLAQHEDLAVMQSEINRLERIVQEFLLFARPAEPHLAAVAAGDLLREVHGLLRPQLQKQAIELKVDLTETARVRADKQQIQQVLINLVQNGAESIGHGGTIHLRAKPGVANRAGQSTPVVVFEVADTGKGIPPEAEQRLFDPFFSTKEGGTGLGLSIAARIADKHGGYLQYQSQPNRGTTFALVLPRITHDDTKTAAH
jgi:signal transduction histidine kinase